MKLFYYYIVAFMCVHIGYSQQPNKINTPITYNENVNTPLTKKERNFIVEAYGDYAKSLVFDNENRLNAFKNLLRNRIKIKTYPPQKSLDNFESINKYLPKGNFSSTHDKFNPLLLNINFFSSSKQPVNLKFPNTNQLLVLYPQNQ